MDGLKLPVEKQQSSMTLLSLDSLDVKQDMEVIKRLGSLESRYNPRGEHPSSSQKYPKKNSVQRLRFISKPMSVPRLLCCGFPGVTPQGTPECWVDIWNDSKTDLRNPGGWRVPHGDFESGRFPDAIQPDHRGMIHMTGGWSGIECYVYLTDGHRDFTVYFAYTEDWVSGDYERSQFVYRKGTDYRAPGWNFHYKSQRTFTFIFEG